MAILANRLHQLGVVDLAFHPAAVEQQLKAALPPNFHPALETAFLRIKELLASGEQCGWLDEREYALASTRVVTPTGERPAGGERMMCHHACIPVLSMQAQSSI